MRRIRPLYFFDKKKTQEMISFLNNNVSDNYINHIMFNPLSPLHQLLPLPLKFLPESYVLRENGETLGLISVAPTKGKEKKIEIQKLFFEENSFETATELIQFAVAKYKAKGAFSILVRVDDYLPQLMTMLVSKCGFSKISYEKLWRVKNFTGSEFNKRDFRSFRNSDAFAIANLYNDSILPHFRPLLSKDITDFKENILQGLSYYSEYKYVLEERGSKTITACITIRTYDNENYVLDIIQHGGIELDINEILNFAAYQIRKRKQRFGLFIKTRRYTNLGEKYESQLMNDRFECVQNHVLLTNSSARILREGVKNGKFTVMSDFCPTKPMPI